MGNYRFLDFAHSIFNDDDDDGEEKTTEIVMLNKISRTSQHKHTDRRTLERLSMYH